MPVIQPSIEISAAHERVGMPVVIGVPLRRGFARDPESLSLTGPGGRPVPLAGRALNRWDDGSLRWTLLTTQASERGTHRLAVAKAGGKMRKAAQAPVEVQNPVRLTRDAQTVTIDNGLVTVVLGTGGAGPVHEIIALGHRYLTDPRDLRFAVNDADTTRETSRTIEVLEDSPLRVRVRVSGAHFRADGSRLLTYRLDVELWAGWPSLRMDYQFFHVEPGRENSPLGVDRIGMDLDLNLDAAATERHFVQVNHGMMYVPREVFNPATVSLVADESSAPTRVEDPAMLLDDVDYPAHLRPPLVATSDWLGVGDGRRSVYVRMQDFAHMRPKRLRIDGASVTLDIWPASAGTLDLPQGRSRRQVITFTFADEPRLKPAEVEKRLSAITHEGRGAITPAWLRHTGEFEADRHMAPAAHLRFEKQFAKVVGLHTPQEMFNLGDTTDAGYNVTYPPTANTSVLKRNAPAIPRMFRAGHNQSPLMDESMPQFYEPIWANNEYDAIWVICTELMRTGNADLWSLARWCTRHNIEVDFVHYHDDRQHNRATPQHGRNHTTSNGAIPSHFWTQGLLQYYCMTGDPDVLEVACALGDKIIEFYEVPEFRESFFNFSREVGWPVLALAHLVDITGEERFARQLDTVLEFCMSYRRPPGFDRMIVPSLWCWSCMFEGADLYQRRTGRKDIAKWLNEFLASEQRECEKWNAEGKATFIMIAMVMAIGYERTGDKRYLRTGMASLEEFLDHKWWSNPVPEIRPMGMTYRGLVRFLHHASEAGMLDHLEYPSARRPKKRASASQRSRKASRSRAVVGRNARRRGVSKNR